MSTHYRGAKTWDQVQLKKEQAVRFAQNILKDKKLADRIGYESVEEYAERKKIRIKNPKGGINMAKSERVTELEQAIGDIWETAQNSDASRSAMLEAFDEIQSKCVEVVPSLDDQEEEEEEE